MAPPSPTHPSSSQARTVPWSTTSEWTRVYHLLYASHFYPDQSEDKIDALERQGVQMVEMWRSRGRLPISVDTTATLVQLLSSQHSESVALRHQLALALIRFVNALVDQHQKSTYARSVASIAESIQLPRYLVDLRHAATHDQLPSLAVLLRASRQTLQLLRQRYWEARLARTTQRRQACQALVLAYKESRKAGRTLTQRDTLQKLVRTCGDRWSVRDALVPTLIQAGGLVPTSKKKRCAPGNPRLSEALLEMWEPLLEAFAASPLWEELLAAIAAVPVASLLESQSFGWTLYAWGAHLVQRLLSRKRRRDSAVAEEHGQEFRSPSSLMDPEWSGDASSESSEEEELGEEEPEQEGNFWTPAMLLERILGNPSRLTPILLQPLYPYLDPVVAERARRMVQVFGGNSVSVETGMECSVDALEERVKSLQQEPPRMPKVDNGIPWSAATNFQQAWNCPIGTLPTAHAPHWKIPDLLGNMSL